MIDWIENTIYQYYNLVINIKNINVLNQDKISSFYLERRRFYNIAF